MKMKSIKQKTIKVVASTIVSCLLLGGQVWGEAAVTNPGGTVPTVTGPSQSTLKINFPDVSPNYWASKHISKLSLQGIVEGDDKGNYNPEAKVSQQDVIIMAIRFMNLKDEALQNKATSVLPFGVRDDAKPYIVEALDKGLLNIQEENGTSSYDKDWGARNASREWVAKITIRAIGKQSDALAQANTSTTFVDNKNISAAMLGYINVAIALKIVDGFEDGSFKPKDSVTRAQMATFLSRADKELSVHPDKVVIGNVRSISTNKITVADDNGKTTDYAIASSAVFYNVKSDLNRIAYTDIKVANQIYLIQSSGSAYYIEILKDTASIESVEGIIDNVSVVDMKITLVIDNKKQVFDLTSNVSVIDKDGIGSSLGSLEKNSRVDIKRNSSTANAKYTQIIIKAVPFNKTGEGIVVAVNLDAKKVSLTDKDSGTAEYVLAPVSTIISKGVPLKDVSFLHVGDAVKYQVLNSLFTSIEVMVPYIEPADSGKLLDLKSDTNNSYLTIKRADNTFGTFSFPNNVEVIIAGTVFSSLKDLQLGDDIKVNLDEKNVIKKITVNSRTTRTAYMATIVAYDPDKKYVTLEENGKPNIYILTDKTYLESDGLPVTQLNFGNVYTKGKKVDITMSQEDKTILKVKSSSTYEGMITQINVNTNDLTLKMDDNSFLPLRLAAATGLEIPTISSPRLNNLSVGDAVKVYLTQAQDVVYLIQAKKTKLFRTVAKDAGSRDLVYKDDAGQYDKILDVDLPIFSVSGLNVTINEIPLDEPIQLTFQGNTLKNITLLNNVRGIVTAVDAANFQLTVQTPDNATQMIQLGAKVKVKKEPATPSVLSAVKVNDRVEITPDADAGYTVTVSQMFERNISAYDAFAKQLSLKKVTLDEQTMYLFHPKAYIHQGATFFNPNFLLENDSVRIYVIDNKIIDLEKL